MECENWVEQMKCSMCVRDLWSPPLGLSARVFFLFCFLNFGLGCLVVQQGVLCIIHLILFLSCVSYNNNITHQFWESIFRERKLYTNPLFPNLSHVDVDKTSTQRIATINSTQKMPSQWRGRWRGQKQREDEEEEEEEEEGRKKERKKERYIYIYICCGVIIWATFGGF